MRKPPVEVARVTRFAVPPPMPPKRSAPSATEMMPVPPDPTVRVPLVSESAMPKVEVATQLARPVVKEVWRMVPPVEEAIWVSVVAPVAWRRSPEVYEEMLVPPFATATTPVTLLAVPPMLRVEVAAYASAVPAESEYSSELAVKEVTPVPPRATARVPVVSERAIPREEVARAVGTAEALVWFASTELAAIVARPMVAFEPPT